MLQSNEQNRDSLDEAKKLVNVHSESAELAIWEWLGESHSTLKVGFLNTVLAGLPQDQWVIHADVDEFCEWKNVPRKLIETQSADVVYGRMVDRWSESRRLTEVRSDINIFDQYPIQDRFTETTLGGNPWRATLFRSALRLADPHHVERIGPKDCGIEPSIIHHFKWISTRLAKARWRAAAFRRMGLPHWQRSARILDLLGEKETKSGCESQKPSIIAGT